jgi:hypothetical protein
VTQVERIAAAIEKLEALRFGASGTDVTVPWFIRPLLNRQTLALAEESYGARIALHVLPEDAELIVTLHRTIDAQLDLLRTARGFYGAGITGPETASLFAAHALVIADSVLGGAS